MGLTKGYKVYTTMKGVAGAIPELGESNAVQIRKAENIPTRKASGNSKKMGQKIR